MLKFCTCDCTELILTTCDKYNKSVLEVRTWLCVCLKLNLPTAFDKNIQRKIGAMILKNSKLNSCLIKSRGIGSCGWAYESYETFSFCNVCWNIMYKIKWNVHPSKHVVYLKKLTSDNGAPISIEIQSKKDTQLRLTVDNNCLNGILQIDIDKEDYIRRIQQNYMENIEEKNIYEFKKLKLSERGRFYLVINLIGTICGRETILASVISHKIISYSHKNLLPTILKSRCNFEIKTTETQTTETRQ